MPFTKKVQKSDPQMSANCLIDTLSGCLFKQKNSIDDMIRNTETISQNFQKDMVEGLEIFEKHYSTTNKAMLKRGHDIWVKLTNERQSLIESQEDYVSAMNHLTVVKRRRDAKAQKKRDRANSDLGSASQ